MSSPAVTAVCPTDPTHRRFTTTAHVMQDWLVDEHGTFLEELSTLETTHGPHPDNLWTCTDCGATAQVNRD